MHAVLVCIAQNADKSSSIYRFAEKSIEQHNILASCGRYTIDDTQPLCRDCACVCVCVCESRVRYSKMLFESPSNMELTHNGTAPCTRARLATKRGTHHGRESERRRRTSINLFMFITMKKVIKNMGRCAGARVAGLRNHNGPCSEPQLQFGMRLICVCVRDSI